MKAENKKSKKKEKINQEGKKKEYCFIKPGTKNLLLELLISGVTVMAVMWVLFWIKGYVPFGNNTLATKDANFQYLDLFAYFKDILAGKNDIDYSFSKMLGGPCIGVFSYYLSSPFNLLLLLFKKSQIIVFMHLTISLKLACAAMTCAFFINRRFAHIECCNEKKRALVTVVMSVCYALGQYSIAQSSNVMWLDGIYMLPLMLLGVYYVANKKGTCYLSVVTGLAILFNWYTGGINCVFASLWLIFELVEARQSSSVMQDEKTQKNTRKITWKYVFNRLVAYAYAMIVGVLLSAVLFLPTIGAMRYSTRGTLELKGLVDFHLLGNMLNSIESYSLGAMSSKGVLSLFCGSLTMLGCIGIFLGKKIGKKKKISRGIMLLCMLLIFYWIPICTIFSLFKAVGSYWYRYSYVGIMCLVFIASEFYLTEDIKEMRWRIAGSAVVFSLVQVGIHLWLHTQEDYLIARTCTFMVATALALLVICSINGETFRSRLFRGVCSLGLAGIFIVELMYGVRLQMNNYNKDIGDYYSRYVKSIEKTIQDLSEYDDSTYRINQTMSRNVKGRYLRANYDESLAYGYWALAGYTSSPDTATLEFMEHLGYRRSGENLCVVNTSILGTDSLMGVKYVLSAYPIKGLKKVKSIESGINNMSVYSNPYYLPMAMVYDTDGYVPDKYTHWNAFKYQNELYSTLLGEKVVLYKRLEHKTERNSAYRAEYTIDIPKGNYVVYGNIPWGTDCNAKLNVNNVYKTRYARWMSPSVFHIPTHRKKTSDTESGDRVATVSIYSDMPLTVRAGSEQFYALDLDKLAEVTEKLRQKAVNRADIKNGNVTFYADATEGQSLFVSIPYSDGWTISVNGNEVEPDVIDGGVYSIPLQEGANYVQMKFHVKYKMEGIAGSVIGILLIFVSLIVKYRKKRIE